MTLSQKTYINKIKWRFPSKKSAIFLHKKQCVFWCMLWCEFFHQILKSFYFGHFANNFHVEARHGKAFEGLLARYFG